MVPRLWTSHLCWTEQVSLIAVKYAEDRRRKLMPILLWLLGVPVVVIVLLYLLYII
jgi:hypothetical protein